MKIYYFRSQNNDTSSYSGNESNKTKQKIGDNPLEKEEERKRCMFV